MGCLVGGVLPGGMTSLVEFLQLVLKKITLLPTKRGNLCIAGKNLPDGCLDGGNFVTACRRCEVGLGQLLTQLLESGYTLPVTGLRQLQHVLAAGYQGLQLLSA